MADESSIEAAARRLNAAVEALEAALTRADIIERAEGDVQEELQMLQMDRSRLAQELDAVKERAARLERVNDEVAQQLDHAIASIEAVIQNSDTP